jgi:hypothetical protein
MKDPAHPGPDSVDDVLREDHERLDALLLKLETAVTAGVAAALDTLSDVVRGLEYHMAWEDGQLFPAVKGLATAKERRSIESLEIDHERLRDSLRGLESTLRAGDFAGGLTQVQWLGTLLKGHNYDEEHGVYVEADRLLSGEERRCLIERFVASRPKEPV